MVLMGVDMPLSAIKGQIAAGIDIIVHLGRMRNKTRKVLEITEVIDYVDGEIRLNPLFKYDYGQDMLIRCKSELVNTDKLISSGEAVEHYVQD